MTYGNGTFVRVSEKGAIILALDGLTWRSINSGISDDLNGVTYGDGTFVAVGDSGTIIQSDPVK